MHHVIALVAQEGQQQGPGGDVLLPFLVLGLVAAFMLIVVMPARRREKKEREEILTKLKKNDEVLTASGIIGIVAMIKEDEVVLKVDESSNTRLRVLKSTIARILNPKEAPKETSKDTSDVRSSKPDAKDS